jgi:hypothetical protein
MGLWLNSLYGGEVAAGQDRAGSPPALRGLVQGRTCVSALNQQPQAPSNNSVVLLTASRDLCETPPVILSGTKDLIFSGGCKILQSLCSFRMTIYGTFAEVSTRYEEKECETEFSGKAAGRQQPTISTPGFRAFTVPMSS